MFKISRILRGSPSSPKARIRPIWRGYLISSAVFTAKANAVGLWDINETVQSRLNSSYGLIRIAHKEKNMTKLRSLKLLSVILCSAIALTGCNRQDSSTADDPGTYESEISQIMPFPKEADNAEQSSQPDEEPAAAPARQSSLPDEEPVRSPEVPVKKLPVEDQTYQELTFPEKPISMPALTGFSGSDFTLYSNWAAYSEDTLFFVTDETNMIWLYHTLPGKTLLYFDGTGQIQKARSNTLEICGVVEDSLFLVEYQGDREDINYFDHLTECLDDLRLIAYDPSTGQTDALLSGVLAAYAEPNGPMVYYVAPQISDVDQGFILTIRGWNRISGEDSLLFTEDRTDPSLYLHTAYDACFSRMDGRLYVEFQYTQGSEFPFIRFIEIVDGKAVPDDTEMDALEKRVSGKDKTAANNSGPRQYTSSYEFPSYTVEVEEGESSYDPQSFFAVSASGERAFLGSAERHNRYAADSLFLFCSGSLIHVYDGDTLYQIQYEAPNLGYLLSMDTGLYFMHNTDSVNENNMHRLVRREDGLHLELVYAVKEIENPGINPYWKRPYAIGPFILHDTYYDGVFIAYNTINNRISATGGKDLVLIVPNKCGNTPEQSYRRQLN